MPPQKIQFESKRGGGRESAIEARLRRDSRRKVGGMGWQAGTGAVAGKRVIEAGGMRRGGGFLVRPTTPAQLVPCSVLLPCFAV